MFRGHNGIFIIILLNRVSFTEFFLARPFFKKQKIKVLQQSQCGCRQSLSEIPMLIITFISEWIVFKLGHNCLDKTFQEDEISLSNCPKFDLDLHITYTIKVKLLCSAKIALT